MRTLQDLVEGGWKIIHSTGTRFVAMEHPDGGKFSLCEVPTGIHMTRGSADMVARTIADALNEYLAVKGGG